MLLIIDGNNIFARIFFAFLSEIENSPFYAIDGVLAYIENVCRDYQPTHLVVTWDSPILKRREEYPAYKADRKPKPEGFIKQLTALRDVVKGTQLAQAEASGYEADDVIYTLSSLLAFEEQVLVLTSDRDLLQVVRDDQVTVELLRFEPHTHRTLRDRFNTLAEVEATVGVKSRQIPSLKGLAGDSDNLPHPAGIGHVWAKRLLGDYNDVASIYHHLDEVEPERIRRLLETGRQQAFLGESLARLRLAPIGFWLEDARTPDLRKLRAEAARLVALTQ